MPSQITRNLKHIDNIYELLAKIIIIIIITYVLYYIVLYIYSIFICGCNNHRRVLVQEGFYSTNFDTSKAYLESLFLRCDNIQKKIDTLNPKIDDLVYSFTGLHKDICYVTLQIDEGLAGNYASNVPDDEQLYPPDVQKQRQEKRKIDSAKYVANLKNVFIKNHDNTPLLECFKDNNSSMTDEENIQLSSLRDNLNQQINNVESSLSEFELSIQNIQKEPADGQLKMFYNTLKYNDKFLSQTESAVMKHLEGFGTSNVFDFKPKHINKDSANPEVNSEVRINMLEKRLNNAELEFNNINTMLQTYLNTTKAQTDEINAAKSITTDTNAQALLIQSNMSGIVKS